MQRGFVLQMLRQHVATSRVLRHLLVFCLEATLSTTQLHLTACQLVLRRHTCACDCSQCVPPTRLYMLEVAS
jgi:hypothetical protein